VEVSQTTRLLPLAAVSIRLRPYRADAAISRQNTKIRAETRCVADAGFDVMAQLRLHQVNTVRIASLKN
jgi:hypothetical protein